jgi:WD40 repeat protein
VRVWDPPRRDARKLFQGPGAVFGVAFSPDGKAIATNNIDGVVRVVRVADGGITELRGHVTGVMRVQFSPDGQRVLSYSSDGTARVWRTVDGTPTRVLADHRRPVEGVGFIESGRRIVSVGDDGRLLAWSPDGSDLTELYKLAMPLTGLEVLSRNDHVVVRDASSAIWDVALDGSVRPVRASDGATVAVLRASPDGQLLATGTDRGHVAVYDTTGWTTIATAKLTGGVRQMRFDPRNRDLVVATHDGHVRVIALGPARTVRFHDVPIAARNVDYSPDGEVLAIVCPTGGTWLYDIPSHTWAYGAEHAAELFGGAFSPDGALFAGGDRRGVVTIRDVATTLAAAKAQP